MSTPTDRYSSFYDPFAEGNVVEPSDIFPSLHIDAPPPYDTIKSILNVVSAAEATVHSDSNDHFFPTYSAHSSLVRSLGAVATVGSASSEITLPRDLDSNNFSITYNLQTNLDIHGQGTIIANCTAPIRLLFCFWTNDNTQPSLYTQVMEKSVDFWYGPTPPKDSTGFLPSDRIAIKGNIVNSPKISQSNIKTPTFLYPQKDYPVRYWLSVDQKNGVLRFGRHYTSLSLALYEARLKQKVEPGVWRWIDDKVCIFLSESCRADLII